MYVEAERRAVDIPRDCMVEWELGRTVRRTEAVAAKGEEQYAGSGAAVGSKGTGHFRTDSARTLPA